jgi:hypothetical protein
LPDDPEFRASIIAYVQWTMEEMLSYTAPDSVVPAARPMPRWSWDGPM